jgi:hypothetical protein
VKINKKSWHYKYLVWLHKDEFYLPRSLCGYFWLLVASLTIIPVVLVLVGIPVVIAIGIGELLKRLHRKLNRNRKSVVHQPSIVVEFVKAKKRKVCPIIEFVDE